MNATETTMIINLLCGAYPGKEQVFMKELTLDVWCLSLQDLPFDRVERAVSAWILSEPWPPTIADIRAKCYNLESEPDVTASSAWEQLLRALRHAYAPESRDIWDQLPDMTKLVVGGYSTFRAWGNTETTSLQSVQRPMFVKRFEEYQRRKRKEAAIPVSLREPFPTLPALTEKPKISVFNADKGKTVQAPKDKMEALRGRLAK